MTGGLRFDLAEGSSAGAITAQDLARQAGSAKKAPLQAEKAMKFQELFA